MPVVHSQSSLNGPQPAAETPVVAVDRLSYSYPDGFAALKDVSLHLREGEKAALVGPNGAGKSTLMLHLNGILGDANAPVRIAGLSLSKEHLPRIRALVGLVFQNPDDQLFSPTVMEDVAFGPLHLGLPESEVRERAAWALEQVGMEGFEDRLSHHLSLGQKKRVAIATVLSMQPQLLVLDEPTAGLDPRGRRQLINLLAALPQTMLVATHDMWLVADLFSRMIVMDEGQIVADGLSITLLQDEQMLDRHGLEPPQVMPYKPELFR